MIKLELPPHIEDRLDLLSLRSGHTRHFYVIEALLEYLDAQEARQSHYDRIAETRTDQSGAAQSADPDWVKRSAGL